MRLTREPARPHDPGYPTSVEFDPARRAALRAIALAGLSTVGLQLVGCPGGIGGGKVGATGVETRAGAGDGTETGISSPEDVDWVPWRDPTPPDGPLSPRRDMVLGGSQPPPGVSEPIAIVVGGGPIDVVFSDGRRARLAVALVVQPGTTPGAVRAGAPEHPAAVRAAASALPGAVLDSADGLASLEERVQAEVLKATPGLVLQGVQAAPALENLDELPGDESSPPPRSAPARAPAPAPPRSSPASAPAPAAPAGGAAATAARRPARAPLTGARVWVPCRKPGCASCDR